MTSLWYAALLNHFYIMFTIYSIFLEVSEKINDMIQIKYQKMPISNTVSSGVATEWNWL